MTLRKGEGVNPAEVDQSADLAVPPGRAEAEADIVGRMQRSVITTHGVDPDSTEAEILVNTANSIAATGREG